MSYKIKISIPIIIFFLSISALIFLSRNLILDIKKTSSEIFSKRSDLLLLEKKSQNSEEFSEIFQKEGKNFERINSSFINPEMPIDFINFMEKTAKDSNLSLKFNIVPVKEKTSWPVIGFQINLTGFYSDLFKFLKKLYYSPYLIEFKNLEILKIEKKALTTEKEIPTGNVKANILINVHAQK